MKAPTIIDTNVLVSMADPDDRHHERLLALSQTLTDRLLIPITVLPEACYLTDKYLGHQAMRRFVHGILTSDMVIEPVGSADLARAHAILEQYADARVDFVDATIVALAKRLNVTRILTLDQRHFRLFRPRHCPAFELLP